MNMAVLAFATIGLILLILFQLWQFYINFRAYVTSRRIGNLFLCVINLSLIIGATTFSVVNIAEFV